MPVAFLLVAAPAVVPAADAPAGAPPPDVMAPVVAALAAGDTVAARQALAALFMAPADQRPTKAGTDLLECRILLAEKQWSRVTEASHRVADAPATTPDERRTAWELLAQCYTALGDDTAAADASARALALHCELTTANLATSQQYFRNRFAVDGSRAYAAARLADSARMATIAGRTDRAAAALFERCLAFPDEPRFRENAVAAGEALLAPGGAGLRESTPAADVVALAAACFLRALDSGLDRVFATTAMLAENQAQLDVVCRATPEALLGRALAGLNRCEQTAQSGRTVTDAQVAEFAAAYHQALALTFRPDGSVAATALASLAGRTKPPWSWLCLLELARLHLREGDAHAALATIERIEPQRRFLGLADYAPLDRLVAAEREFLQGVTASAQLDQRQAAKHFGMAAELGGPLLISRARFEQARALELVGESTKAAAVYAGLCPSTPPRDRGPSDSPGLQDAAGIAADRGGTAESAISPRPALAVLAQGTTPTGYPPSPGPAGPPTSGAAMGAKYSAHSSAAPDMLRGVRGDASSRPPEASSPVPAAIARATGIAVARLAEFAEAEALPRRSPVRMLPDDRTTRGDWFLGYGVERYILCAQNYRFDRVGGPMADFAVHFATTDAKEPSRLWVSAKQTDDPAVLWDPVRRLRLPGNRDDRGEQYPLGQGPDLLLDCAIPAGEHVLSLYFVNDHHYYEANRRYTVELRENGALLALADVHDFGGGVYKRVRVDGVRRLQVRIRRDASMNVLLQGVFLDPLYQPRPLPGTIGMGRRPTTPPGRRVSPDPSGVGAAADTAEHSHIAAPPGSTVLTRKLATARSPAPLWARCEALRAEGRWRDAETAFAEFAKAVPEWALVPVMREMVATDSPSFGEPDGRGRLYPPGRHPLDLIWARLLDGACHRTEAVPAAIVRSQEPFVTPTARLLALAALEAAPGGAASPIDPELRVIAARRLLGAGCDRDAAEVLRRCLVQPGRADLRHEAALGLLKLAGRTGTPADQVLALWRECDAVLADARADVRDAAVLHTATALAAAGDPGAAQTMLQRHSNPATWQVLARQWEAEKARTSGGAKP